MADYFNEEIFREAESGIEESIQTAAALLNDWRGDSFAFGTGSELQEKPGEFAREFGTRALVVASFGKEWSAKPVQQTVDSLQKNNITITKVAGVKPNTPKEDVYRLALFIAQEKPDVIVVTGGGSNIDAVKGAAVLAAFSPSEVAGVLGTPDSTASTVEPYFGTGIVSKMIEATGKPVIPIVAVQTAAGSAAHLTKYSNITDRDANQKKIILDNEIIPKKAVFDYNATLTAPEDLTLDGGFDGIAHCWEVFMGASGKPFYDKVKDIALHGIKLILHSLVELKKSPDNIAARAALGLGTDLGGYAIMTGSTNGPHLGTFSLVDLSSHGRACAVLNPYYTLLFSEKIQDQLHAVGGIYKQAGYIHESFEKMNGRELGKTVAMGMLAFAEEMGYPTTLRELGADEQRINKMLADAKNPQLKMKLLNMPEPMDAERGDIERFMKPVLYSALTGNLDIIMNEAR